MRLALFRKGPKENRSPVNASSIYNALMEGLDEIERQFVDRVPIALHETGPSPNVTGRPISESNLPYYPIEMLTARERRMIEDEKSYGVVALVGRNVGNVVEYMDRGVEVRQRTYMPRLFLSSLGPESGLRWVTEGGVFHAADAIGAFATLAANDGDIDLTPEKIRQAVQEGIREYRVITGRLMERGGVYGALAEMERRQYTPLEQIMADMRKDIASAASARN